MRTLQFALLASLLAALGCRSNNSQVLVEQEARMLEDEVYHLEAQLDNCCRAKEAAVRENEDLRRQSAGGSGSGSSGGGEYRPPAVELPGRSSTPSRREAPSLEPPTIELPEPSETPPANLTPGGEQPAAMNGQPSKLSINKRLTGGLDRDSAGGDEGIMVMVEPRDERGRLVRMPGAVSVVVMDPSQVGDAARVARWDFQAHEFDGHFKNATFGQGLQYELEWPGERPQNRELVLFVRYVADDGTKLTADAPLAVRLASDSPRSVSTAEDDRLEHEPRSRVKSHRGTKEPPHRQARGDRPQWSPDR